MMPVSVCLSVCLSISVLTFVHCGHRVQWIPDIFACLNRWMSLLLTDTASPGSSDGMMPGFLVEEGGMEKLVIVAISLILLIFYRWTSWRICLYERKDVRYLFNIFVWTILKFFSVENALCLKMVRLITTSDHIGLKRRHIVRILPTYKTRNRICVTDVRNDGIKCVTEKCVPRNSVTAGN